MSFCEKDCEKILTFYWWFSFQRAFCAYCNDRIWGLGRQGFKCTQCKLLVHKKCHKLVRLVCTNDASATLLSGSSTSSHQGNSADSSMYIDDGQGHQHYRHPSHHDRSHWSSSSRQNGDSSVLSSGSGSDKSKCKYKSFCVFWFCNLQRTHCPLYDTDNRLLECYKFSK